MLRLPIRFAGRFSFAAAMVVAAAAPAAAFSVQGLNAEFWDQTSWMANVDVAQSYAEANASDATFVATTLDYPNGSINVSDNTSLADLLGANAEDLAGAEVVNLQYSIWRMTGFLNLEQGTHAFRLGSDDGFRLSFDDVVVAEHSRPRAFAYTDFTFEVTDLNPIAVDLLWYENSGHTGMSFQMDGVALGGDQLSTGLGGLSRVAAADVPVPAALPLLGAGLAALGFASRRRTAARKI